MESKELKIIFGHLIIALLVIAMTVFSLNTANASIIIFQNDDSGDFASDGIVLNVDDQASDSVFIQFGSVIAETLKWSIINSQFEISNDLDLTDHQLKTARMENVAALPGGSLGLSPSSAGRFVLLTATDSVAPGCTTSACSPGSYVWNGTTWEKMSSIISSGGGSDKIVTVGPAGRDYTTISAASSYLNAGSGGEIWLDPGYHNVTSSINLDNIKLKGADDKLTTVYIGGSGIFQVRNTKFKDLTIELDAAITSDMGLDALPDNSVGYSLEFEQTDIKIPPGKVLLDSTAATAPKIVAQFENSSQSSGGGSLVKTVALANLFNTSFFKVIDKSGVNPLKMADWNVTVTGGGAVQTSGTISATPNRIIEVTPGMDIQAAIDSLGASGGTIKLLVGTHELTNSIFINNDNITLTGEGPSTILQASASTWIGGVTNNDALIQVGSSAGNAPGSNVIIRNLQLKVEPNIHGIQVNGGVEIKVMDNLIESTGAKFNTRVGLLFTDSTAEAGRRFMSARNYINSSSSANRWVDGVHFDGNADFIGQLFGYGNGITDSIINETIVAEAQETSYAFSQVTTSGIFSNRARDLASNPGAFGMFLNDCRDVIVVNNTMEGASASANGITLFDNVDNSVFLGNTVRGGPVNFNVGIEISNSTSQRNIVTNNQFANVNQRVIDNGTDTKLETLHHRSVNDPTSGDDITNGFEIGTIWINTASQNAWISVDHTAGAAVWKQIDAAGGLTVSSTPPATCNAGNSGAQFMDSDSGIVYVCDTSNGRNKWLGQSEIVLWGDENGNCNSGSDVGDNNCTVDWGNGLGSDNGTVGFYLPYDATVTGYGFSADNDSCFTGSFDVEIWSSPNNSNDNTYSFAGNAATGLNGEAHNSNSLNLDLDGNRYIIWGIDNNCGQNIDDFNVVLYLRYRNP